MDEGTRGFATILSAAILGILVFAAGAQASTDDIIAPSTPPYTPASGWQAGTCETDVPVCSVATPGQFFELAAGHPQVGFTQFIVRNQQSVVPAPVGGPEEPIGELKTVHVDLPVGLSVNPQATPQCPNATGEANPDDCPANSKVGQSQITGSVLGHPSPVPINADVYNIVPPDGEPALFGFSIAGTEKVFLRANVNWDTDYHEEFTIDVPELPIADVLPGGLILKNRLVFNGRSGDGTFITTPSTCRDPHTEPEVAHIYSTYLLASSIEESKAPGYSFPASAEPALESPLPPGKKPIDCVSIPYKPTTGVEAGTGETDSPAGATTEIKVPHIKGGATRESSNTREVKVALPGGMGLNPSAGNGLVACTDAQFGKGTRNPVTCPPESRIGSVEVETPPLPAGSLKGDVFVGEQKSRDPLSGELYRILIHAFSDRYDVSARFVGNVIADPVTGQLTTRLSELPQVPFSSVSLKLTGGPRAPLGSPTTSGPPTMTTTMTPWSGNPAVVPTDEFSLASAPGGGACAPGLGERPFAPAFAGRGSETQGGAFTSLSFDIGRESGNQELKGVEIVLPRGLSARLAGLIYCPEASLAAAAANSGVAEAASSSCPADSLVGGASIVSGSGPEPLKIEGGKAFLTGPYNGAPLSLTVITPATAGPFDLGTVVVRVALFVDPKTAQVRTVSDPLPHVYGGALLDVRSVTVRVDRPNFAINPTNCSAASFDGLIRGGGADPNSPAAFTSVVSSSPFQPTGCENLGFGPKLFLRAFGATKRTKNPKLKATLFARKGDANIARASVTLPKAFILDQESIAKVCTRVQFAANACPSNSIYGFAEATSPLLDGPLKGPVYLRSSDNTLPDLVAALDGQVSIELAGRTDTVRGRIRNTFDMVPDVPVTKFELTIRGGKKKGLLVNSRPLCARKWFARSDFTGQNGKRAVKKKLRLQVKCKKKKKKKGGRGKK